jgi:hypothetical protein
MDEDDDSITIVERKQLQEEKQQKKEELIAKNLEKYEQELATIIADYGGTIRQLDNDEWVMIVAYLDSSRESEGVNRVMVKARKGDIDSYDLGDIEFDELVSRMIMETE